MFIRTQSNKLINVDNIIKAEINLRTDTFQHLSSLIVTTSLDNYCVFSGNREECKLAMTNLCEAVAKGASLISYYAEETKE